MAKIGYLTLGAELDTKDFERELKQAEADLRRFKAEGDKLAKQKVKAEADVVEAERTLQLTKEQFTENLKLVSTQEEKNALLKEQNYLLGIMEAGIEGFKQDLEDINTKIKNNNEAQEGTNAKIDKLKSKLDNIKGFEKIKASLNSISDKISGIIKKAVKWGLAIFSVGSMVSLVRNAMSTITQYDTQLATNIEYIRWALAMALKPVVEYIVNLAYKLLGILRYIIKLLFNYDIFAKAGTEAFRKAKENTSGIAKNIGKATKNAKELNKQLASFDEMNILGDNVKQAGDTGGTGGVGGEGITMPSLEIPEITDIKIDWGKIWDTIEHGLGIIKTKIAPKIQDFFTNIGRNFYDNASGWTTPLSNTFGDFFVTLGYNAKLSIGGIGDVFVGLVKTVRGLFTGDLPTIASGMFQTLGGIFQMGVGSLGIMFNVLATPFRLAFNTMMEIARVFFDWLSKQTGIKALKWDNLMVGLGNTIDKIKSKFNVLKTNIGTIFKNIGTSIGNMFKSAFTSIFNKLVSAIESRLNKPINAINKMINTINKILPKNQKLSKLSTIKLPRLAKGGIVNLPGSGVPIGTAIAGERGKEGVIPLTDSQQMALLGEAIGKYITINANITNTMNGRVISRELQKIQNDDNFAYNR